MWRIAALAVVLLAAAAPAGTANAGWSPAERGRGGDGPETAVEVGGGAAGSPLTVRVRGGKAVTLPGSEGGGEPVAAAGPGGLVVVAWTDVECTASGEFSSKSSCESAVRASTWRRGAAPAPPVQLSREDGTFPEQPATGIAPDGTVLVVWKVLDDDYIGVSVGVHAAVARGSGPFAVSTLAADEHAGVAVVRGAAQVALVTEGRGGTAVALAGARDGRLGAPRVDALAQGAAPIDLQLLRSRRGDRLLMWDTDTGVAVRHGAPGRPIGRPLRLRSDDYGSNLATLGDRGEFALLLTRAGPGGFERFVAVRGRTGSRAVRRQGLVPASYTGFGSGAGALAIDRASRTIVVWERVLRPSRGDRATFQVFGAAAPRGGRFGRGSRLSTLRRPGTCDIGSLVALPAGGAYARWSCNPAGRARPFRQHAVFRPGG